ncbi:MAG: MFS transporter [Oryzihumus sp.]
MPVAVVVLCLVQFVDVLGVTSAVVAIPAMLAGVRAGPALAGPLATAYAMFFGGLLVLGARLGHRYGHLRLLLAGLAAFAVAGGLGALAHSGWQLVAARGLQGVASAMTVPAALTLLLATAGETTARRRALALWSAAGATAGACGLFVGGALTDTIGWRAVFWINVPIALALGAGALLRVRARPHRDRAVGLDLPGAALLTVAVMAVVVGAALLQDPESRVPAVLCLVGALAVGGVLRWWLRRAADPAIPPAVLRHPRLAAGALGSFVNTAATSSTAVLLAIHLQRAQGLSAFRAGLVLLALSVAVVPGSALAASVTRRWSPRTSILVGTALLAAGNVVVAVSLGTLVLTGLGLGLLGLGLGLSSVGCNDLGTAVNEEHVSTATGVLNTGAQLGTAVGVALLVLVASGGRYGAVEALPAALVLAAAGCAVALVVLARGQRSA